MPLPEHAHIHRIYTYLVDRKHNASGPIYRMAGGIKIHNVYFLTEC